MQLAINNLNISENYSVASFDVEKEDLQKRIGDIVATTVQAIAQDYEYRCDHYRENIKLLDGGIWMQNIYYKALKETHQTTRLEWMVSKNRFYDFHPTKYFTLIPDKSSSGYAPAQIQLKKKSSPSEALAQVRRGPALLDCATVCQIGQYQALHDVLGKEKFDKLFSHEQGKALLLSNYSITSNPLMVFLITKDGKDILGKPGDRPILRGQRTGFKNVDNYKHKHTCMGESNAFNAVCLSSTPEKQTFVGIGLPSQGVTEDEIEQILVNEYNAIPTNLDPVSDDLANKLFYFKGKEGYRKYCAFFDPISSNREEVLQLFVNKFPLELCEKQLKFYEYLKKPISVEEAKKENPDSFGYISESGTMSLHVDLIQKLVQLPLEKISYDYAVSLRIATQNSSYC